MGSFRQWITDIFQPHAQPEAADEVSATVKESDPVPSKELLPHDIREQSHEFRNEVMRLKALTRQVARELDTTNRRIAGWSKAMRSAGQGH